MRSFRILQWLWFLFIIPLQIQAQGPTSWQTCFSSSQVIPPGSSTATATALFTLNANGTLTYNISYSGLSGPPVVAHLHSQAECGFNGPPVGNLVLGDPITGTTPPLGGVLINEILLGRAYIDIHTAAFPGGEIRGQLLNSTCGGCDDCNSNMIPDHCDITCGAPGGSCDVTGCGGSADINQDGIPDECISFPDCNHNNIPDECDIDCGPPGDVCNLYACGTSADLNNDSVPDECAPTTCEDPTICCIDAVFVVDTSGSMYGAGQEICAGLTTLVSTLQSEGINLNYSMWGVSQDSDDLPLRFPCLTNNVKDVLGVDIPNINRDLGDCPHTFNSFEDWGAATAIVANSYPWTSGCTKMIIPISDAGPSCGNPCKKNGKDKKITENALSVAQQAGVTVVPVVQEPSNDCTIELADKLARGTGRGNDLIIVHESGDYTTNLLSLLRRECCFDPPQAECMVGWWPLDEQRTWITADIQKARYGIVEDPTVHNNPLVIEGKVRRARDFDGSDDHVYIPPITNDPHDFGAGSFTIDAWVRPMVNKTSMEVVRKTPQFSSPAYGYKLALANGYPSLTLTDTSGLVFTATSSIIIPLDAEWHFLMVVVDRTMSPERITFYVDGNFADVYTLPSNFGSVSTTAALRFAGPTLSSPNAAGPSFKGGIDEVELFSCTLSSSDMCEIYKAGSRGKCKENINCNEFCPGNLIPNGSFECGEGDACPQNLSGDDGLGGIFDWSDGCLDVPAWVGEVGHQNDCNYHDQGRNSLNWASEANHGRRFVWLDVDYNAVCSPVRQECVESQMLQPLQEGYKYNLRFSAIGKDKLVCFGPPFLHVDVAGQAIDFKGNGGTTGKVLTGPTQKNKWTSYNHAFTPTTEMLNSSTPTSFKVQANRGRGIVVDSVCLQPISIPRGTYSGDRLSGGSTLDSDLPGNPAGIIIGGTDIEPGLLGKAMRFDGVNGNINVPHYSDINFGTEDFALSVWVRPDSVTPSFIPLLGKQNGNSAGYLLYLSNGKPALYLAGPGGSQTLIASNGPTIQPFKWTHVAVSSHRNDPEEGIVFYVNGELVQKYGGFAITVDSTNSLLLGSGFDPLSGTQAYFDGMLDDVRLFGAVLNDSEVSVLAEEGITSKESVTLSTAHYFCGTAPVLNITPKICNFTGSAQTYFVEFSPIAAALDPLDDCTIDGPTAMPPSVTVPIPAGTCPTLPMNVIRPPGLTSNTQKACYELVATNMATEEDFSVSGYVSTSTSLCISPAVSQINVPFPAQASISFNVSHGTFASSRSKRLAYEIRGILNNGTTDPNIRLNGLPPGKPVKGEIVIPSGTSANVTINAQAIRFLPNTPHKISMWIDNDGDRIKEIVAETILWSVVGDCNNNGIQDDQETNNNHAIDCNNNQVPDSCDISIGTSLDTNGDTVPDECQ